MSSINEKFFDDLSKGATWSAGVAFKRSNPLPLDRYSVFETKALAEEYALTNAVAYPGQVIAVMEEGKVGVYVLAQKATETEVEGEDGETTIETTYSLTLQEISPDLSEFATYSEVEAAIAEAVGAIVIPEIPDITASGDNVVNIEADGHTVSVSHAKKGPAGGATAGAEDNAEVVEFGSTATIKVPKVTVDEYGHVNAVEEKEFKVAIPALPEDKNTEYTLEYTSKEVTEGETAVTKKFIQLKDDAGSVISEIDASEFIKDGMLTDVAYDDETNSLTFAWNTDSGIKTDTVILTDILDPYTAGAKIVIDGTEISHAEIAAPVEATAEAGTRKYITEVETDGYGHITGYKTATETVVDTNTTYTISAADNKVTLTPSEGDATTVTLDVYTKEEIDEIIGEQPTKVVDEETGKTTYTGATGIYEDIYTKDEVTDLISSFTGGESAADVLAELNKYKTSNDNRVKDVEDRADAIEEKLETIQEGAQVNLIDFVDEVNFEVTDKKLTLKGVENLSEVLNSKLTKSESDIETNHFAFVDGKLTLVKDYEAGAQVNKIENVNADNFEITADKTLNLKAVTVAQVTGLNDALNAKLNKEDIDANKLSYTAEGKLTLAENYVTTTVYAAEVGDLSKLIRASGKENSTLIDEINDINTRISWQDL